ncbi:MAG: YfhO family protein, partial [Thermoanaerobaculia bacterium]
PFRYRWIFFSGTLLFLLLSLGRYFPLHYAFQKIPLISTIRFPEKYLIFLIIFFSFFLILNFKKFEKISLAPSIIVITSIFLLLSANLITSGKLFKNYISGTTYQEITIQPKLMQKNLLIAVLISILLALFFFLFNNNRKLCFLLPLLCFGDLYYGVHHRITPYFPSSINSPLSPILKEQGALRLLHNEVGAEYNPANKNITLFRIETLQPHFGCLQGFSYAFSRSVDSMEPAYLNRKLEDIDYKLWGISHIILSGMKAPKDGDFKRFFGYDLLRIDRNATYIWFFEEETKEAKPLPSPQNIENPTKIQIKIKNKKKGILWIGYSNLPGWRVFFNGKEAKMADPKAEGLNVSLEPGENKIEFIYKAPGFTEGIGLMVSGLFLCVIILLWKKGN